MTLSLCSGILNTNAAIINRAKCGFCEVVYRVYLSSLLSKYASAARGSIALGTSFWLW